MSAAYRFGPFEIDARTRKLRRDGQPMVLSDRYVRVLLHLAVRAGQVVAKDDLVTAGWADVAVGDNSLEQAISALRRALGSSPDGQPYVETVARQGYRLVAEVTRSLSPEPDDAIDRLLAPHRGLIEGRAALETLERASILRAREVFAQVIALASDEPRAHVGLANACVLQFEMTRTDDAPDLDALQQAVRHAYEACRLNPEYAEAWATLGFVLPRTGQHVDGLAASRRAIALEPDNWRHHFRLASIAWGEERLQAARRTLALLPGFSLAHWLAATVLVSRQMLEEAAQELNKGIATDRSGPASRFSGVALHWLIGLILLAQGDEAGALEAFDRELQNEASGHLYARECCANTWYAIGAVRLRQGSVSEAVTAFSHALERVARHANARLGLAVASGTPGSHSAMSDLLTASAPSMDAVLCGAAAHVLRGSHTEAAAIVDNALGTATSPSAAWFLPVEPLLNVGAEPDAWAPVLGRLRSRSA